MNILLLGSGGREHALAWKLKQSTVVKNIFTAPGNAGTAQCGANLAIPITDFEGIKSAIHHHGINMLVVGPEEPLVKGIVDFLKADPALSDLHIIGPSAAAARLEGSKAFAKSFMQRHGIPTAAYRQFSKDSFQEGFEYVKNHSLPIVLKADGLAAGKGVLICQSHLEALAELDLMLLNSKFGEAGNTVVVEQFLTGIEISVFVLTDGKHYVLLPEAKDYKRIGEGDTGLNTGGMGAVSPIPFFDDILRKKVISQIIEPTIKGISVEGLDYCGFVFFGLMISDGEPYVIEYNCRLGDPETQTILPRLKNDLVELFKAATTGKLTEITTQTLSQSSATIVAVSGGYPGDYSTGKVVLGLQDPLPQGSYVFHAGTIRDGDEVLTSGGRVLAVTSLGPDITQAAERSLFAINTLYFENIKFRSDIGFEFFESEPDAYS